MGAYSKEEVATAREKWMNLNKELAKERSTPEEIDKIRADMLYLEKVIMDDELEQEKDRYIEFLEGKVQAVAHSENSLRKWMNEELDSISRTLESPWKLFKLFWKAVWGKINVF